MKKFKVITISQMLEQRGVTVIDVAEEMRVALNCSRQGTTLYGEYLSLDQVEQAAYHVQQKKYNLSGTHISVDEV